MNKSTNNKKLMTNNSHYKSSVISHKSQAGFTLVELIVAMSIFLIAIVIIVGAFIRSLRTQRIVNHLMAVNSNTSLVIEQMAREIRTGYEFKLNPAGSACVGGQRRIKGKKIKNTIKSMKIKRNSNEDYSR